MIEHSRWTPVKPSLNFLDFRFNRQLLVNPNVVLWCALKLQLACAVSLLEVSPPEAESRKCLGLHCCNLKPNILVLCTDGKNMYPLLINQIWGQQLWKEAKQD